MHGKLHVSVHACTNDNLGCTKCEVHDRVRKHVIRCTKKRVPRFLILEALNAEVLRVEVTPYARVQDHILTPIALLSAIIMQRAITLNSWIFIGKRAWLSSFLLKQQQAQSLPRWKINICYSSSFFLVRQCTCIYYLEVSIHSVCLTKNVIELISLIFLVCHRSLRFCSLKWVWFYAKVEQTMVIRWNDHHIKQ